MIRLIKFSSGLMLGAMLLVGCGGPNEYHPNAEPTKLAAYAATKPYPANTQPQEDLRLTASVNRQSGQVTIRNFSGAPLQDVDVWINQGYVLHLNKIEPNGSRTVNPGDFYNANGSSLENTPPEGIRKIQIQTHDNVLYNIQGPQFE
jgi:hypothetical protein